MTRRIAILVPALAVVAAMAVMVAPSSARADELGRQGTLVISADNLFGFAFGELQFERNGPDVEFDFSVFGIGMTESFSPMWTPRLSLDGFVIDSLSVGGSLGLLFFDDDDNDDRDDGLGIFIAARVGYLYMFTDWVGIWPRGGFTFYTFDQDFFDRNQFALDVEVPFPFVINENFGIHVGPALHLGLAGEHDLSDDDRDFKEWGIGIAVGLLGWIGL